MRRSEYFSSMLGALENPDKIWAQEGPSSEPLSRSLRAFEENTGVTKQMLAEKLQRCIGQPLASPISALVATIVLEASRLALRMGTQKAHVMLQMPAHRDYITLGEHFEHEGDTFGPGSLVQVDLTMRPCMVRIGDGRDDLTSIKVICKGSVLAFPS